MRIDRTALYEQVWQEPLKTLAPKFGISDVALRRKCVDALIPVPERGYWAKLQAGKAIKRPALPKRPPGMELTVPIGEPRYHSSPNEEEFLGPIPDPPTFENSMEEVEAGVATAVGKVALIRTFDSVHPAVGKLLKADELRRKKQLASKWPIWDEPLFDTPFEIRRLKILNSLFRAAAKFGGASEIRGREGKDITITVHYAHVRIAVDTPANLRIDPRRGNLEKADAKSKMRLVIRSGWDDGERFAWEDADGSKVEDHLTEILIKVIVTGEQILRDGEVRRHNWWLERRKSIIEQRRKAVEEAERRARELAAKERQARIDGLLAHSAALHQAETIRLLVERARSATPGFEKEAIESWATWALSVADDLDPVQSGALSRSLAEGGLENRPDCASRPAAGGDD